MLVSVMDLAEQYGSVVFDVDGVCVETDGHRVTRIGDAMSSRLYSFDLPALKRHKVRWGARVRA